MNGHLLCLALQSLTVGCCGEPRPPLTYEMIERIPELRTLSASDKLTLVTELWADLESNPEDIPITPEQIAEVDKRLEEYRQNPGLGSSWKDVKARILAKKR